MKSKIFEPDPRAGRSVSADYPLFIIMLTILGLGLFMVLDASYARASQNGVTTHGDPYYFFKQQVRYAAVGLAALVAAMRLPYWRLSRYGGHAVFFCGILLVLVMVPHIGVHSHGAARWLRLGPIRVQPSELSKIGIILYLSAYISRRRRNLGTQWATLFGALLPVIVTALLIIKQPDLGTALTLVATAFVMLAVGGAKFRRLAAIGTLGLALVLVQAHRNPYSNQRLIAFFNPTGTDKTYTYQVNQSVQALQAGGLRGLGAGQGDAKFFHLPAPYTDFIASTLGEEFGLLGSLTLVALFFGFSLRGYMIANRCPNAYGTLLASGLCTMVTVQALLNLAVITRTAPDTGVPLPLVSFGGSSLVLVLFATGLLLGVSRWPELIQLETLVDRSSRGNRRIEPEKADLPLPAMDLRSREAAL